MFSVREFNFTHLKSARYFVGQEILQIVVSISIRLSYVILCNLAEFLCHVENAFFYIFAPISEIQLFFLCFNAHFNPFKNTLFLFFITGYSKNIPSVIFYQSNIAKLPK